MRLTRVGAGVVAAGFVVVLARCVVFTGSGGPDDGYTSKSRVPGCAGASDCDGGKVCCLSDITNANGPKVTCRNHCSPADNAGDDAGDDASDDASGGDAGLRIQLCKMNAECSLGVSLTQSCDVIDGGSAVTIQACGPVPFCVLQ